MLKKLWLLYDAENGGSGGGGQGSPPANNNPDPSTQGNGGSTTPTTTPTTPPSTQGGSGGGGQGDPGGSPGATLTPELANALNKLIERAGDPEAAATLLYTENYQLRERNRELSDQMAGKTLLTPEQTAQWERYQELGAPDQLARTIRSQEIQAVASLAGYSPAVLAKLDAAGDSPIQFEIREIEQDGKKTPTPFVITGPGENDRQSLQEYAAQQWPEFMPSLKPGIAPARTPGTPYPQQSSGTPPQTDVISTYITQHNEAAQKRSNPLIPS